MAISCNKFWRNFYIGAMRMRSCHGNTPLDRKINLLFEFQVYSANYAS